MDRFWLKHYPPGVPADVYVMQYSSLVHLMDDGFRQFAARDAYAFMDRQYNELESRPGEAVFATSLFVQASVISCNTPGFATTDAGLKAFATDAEPNLKRLAIEGLGLGVMAQGVADGGEIIAACGDRRMGIAEQALSDGE